MNEQNASAIEVRSLWQVFGHDPKKALADALNSNDPGAALAASDHIAAVRDASLSIAPGELFVIMGLSGSGKSTLVRCISRLVEPTAGSVSIEGQDILSASKTDLIKLRREKIGMVFQHFGLFPHLSVIDNVAYPLKVQGIARKDRHARAAEMIDMVGLKGREGAFPRELSGGQRQRVGIARSLAGECTVWLLDEPFSALDPLIRRQLQDEFLEISAKLNTTIVFITHDIAEALKLADRIAIMRDGQIVQIGTPTDIVLNPVDDYVRAFSRDIPKGRHMTLSALMEPINGTVPNGPNLAADLSLEDALARCATHLGPVAITDGSGKVVGQLDPSRLTEALAVKV